MARNQRLSSSTLPLMLLVWTTLIQAFRVNAPKAMPLCDSCVEVKARIIPTYVEVVALPRLPRQHHPGNMTDSTSSHIDSNTLEPLRIQTRLRSRYMVFDASGRLPFDIVFGLRRRSDSDPCDISFQTTKSLLDVPYALANSLLSLYELRTSTAGP
jgi:hypothetical protein